MPYGCGLRASRHFGSLRGRHDVEPVATIVRPPSSYRTFDRVVLAVARNRRRCRHRTPHKSSHTIAAVDSATGELLGDKTIGVGVRGVAALLVWARGLAGERVWALEDCRHVSGALERFLIARGERVVRISTRLMAGTRRSSRERGKSDQIDAIAVARAALAAGIDTLPTAALAGPELDLRLLVDHRQRLV
jgi:transposase